jgi:hypothetical protein
MYLSNFEDLKTEPLPKGKEDENIPSQIARLDEHITFLESQIAALKEDIKMSNIDKDALIKRADELHITDDGVYKIIREPVYPKKHVDVEALKRLAPDKHNLIVQNLQSKAMDKLKEQMNKIQISIAQADVKAVISDKAMLAMVIPEPKEPSGWNIVVVKR